METRRKKDQNESLFHFITPRWKNRMEGESELAKSKVDIDVAGRFAGRHPRHVFFHVGTEYVVIVLEWCEIE